ncbi:hypothetical protein XENORESO_012740 [Xenotaenia resolanae]|uniref:Uncharacterized protein n=1 Tax=Xenotaenia resolanae TaxID=208358 RepID=A0ABV0X630_9TELE
MVLFNGHFTIECCGLVSLNEPSGPVSTEPFRAEFYWEWMRLWACLPALWALIGQKSSSRGRQPGWKETETPTTGWRTWTHGDEAVAMKGGYIQKVLGISPGQNHHHTLNGTFCKI